MRSTLVVPAAVLAALLLGATPVLAGPADPCSDGSCFPGGGDPATDCLAELRGVLPNLPYPVPGDPDPAPRTEQRCFDGDAGCDLDGEANGVCRFPVDLCIANTDPNLPACTPAPLTRLKLKKAGKPLTQAAKALPLGSGPACTEGATVDVKLAGTKSRPKAKSVALRIAAETAAATDEDVLTLTCLPRDWPAQAADHSNRRSAARSKIKPKNAAKLELLWDFPVGANVTSTPTVDGDRVYATSWNGFLYALDRETGVPDWSYDTGAEAAGGIKGSATLTADGRIVVGDADVNVHCLDAATGEPLWTRDLELLPQDHVWGAPTVVGRRVFVPVASDGDTPCTKGRVVALDLDTGEPLWTMRTAPDRVCEDDTTVGCTGDLDCGASRCVGMCAGDRGTACVDDLECGDDAPCEDVVGGGVTATPASDPTGEVLYVASVGCFTNPRVGYADRLFRVRQDDGTIEWAEPDFPGEPFGSTRFNDYGFLNGPIVVNGASPMVIGASKDGKVYARDAVTGAERWTAVAADVNEANGAFAGFGLFNGAPALAGGRVFTSLNAFGDGTPADIVHTQAFDAATGADAWVGSLDTGPTWGSVSHAGGVVFVGTANLAFDTPTELHAFDAEDGTSLQVFPFPQQTASGPSIVGDQLFIGYGLGILGPVPGGVQAYELR